MIDSHCHLDFSEFDLDREQVINYARQCGVTDIIIPGVDAVRWGNIHKLCSTQTYLHPCYGIHPYTITQHTGKDLDKLSHWIKTHKCVALGECGLDFRRGQAEQALQLQFFETQLVIAKELDKPVVIHSVRATEQVINSLKKHNGLTGMVHSYSGSYEQACRLIDLGFSISLGGLITHERASRLREVAKKIPLDTLLMETDAPDQPDASHNKERNEPAYLVNVLDCLAYLRTESRDEIEEQTTLNTKTLFGI